MWLEGIEVNCQAFTVKSTPGGNEAMISMYATKELWNLKPNTHVVIGYQDPSDRNWYLMFEGSFSRFDDSETATQGRSLSLIARDYRMDIRRAPAALAWDPVSDPLKVRTYYNPMGIFQNYCVKGIHPKGRPGTDIQTYNGSGLLDLSSAIKMIAGSAFGAGLTVKNGEYTYNSSYGTIFNYKVSATNPNTPEPSTMLDAIIRGLWLQSVSGTSMMSFLNRRLRVEKKIFTPINAAGYSFWKRQDVGMNMASHLMGNARFSSLEAAFMRMAAVFSVHPHSCATPSLIPVDGESASSKWVMDPNVRRFLVERQSAEFGAPQVINTTMLLPNLEFTAPPNFNVIPPSFYDNKSTSYDISMDVTRAHFTQTHVLSDKGGNELGAMSIQFPNSLFDNNKIGAPDDEHKRRVPPMTTEEKYKGVNVYRSTIANRIVMDDARSLIASDYTSNKAREAIDKEIKQINEEIKQINGNGEVNSDVLKASGLTAGQVESLERQLQVRRDEKVARREKINNKNRGNSANAAQRHSIIKFMNQKFKGRVSTCEMMFNPFITCGFPGLIMGDYNNPDKSASESIIGMVQQVKHQVWIRPDGTDASTAIVMSNSRLMNEPTSVNDTGAPLYMRPTRGKDAEIDINTYEYKNAGYTIPAAKAPEQLENADQIYAAKKSESVQNYPYVKDLVTLTIEDLKQGKRNKVYLDDNYEPNRIAKFYSEVFRGNSNHLMIGSFVENNETKYYMYDTIHEAVTNLARKKDMLEDYQNSYEYVRRNVCSIDEYFINILGCSVAIHKKNGDTDYEIVQAQKSAARQKYYGVTTAWYNDNQSRYSRMSGPGGFSTIEEHVPVTAFIQERVDAVNNYIRSLKNTASNER